jgi:antitoxin component YwqK of YwqJK toxin-antitoxin module
VKRRLVAIVVLVLGAGVANAGPPVTAPPASTEPRLPADVVLDPVEVPATGPFKPRPAGWWRKKKPCPPGTRVEKMKNDRRGRRPSEDWATAVVCRAASGEQHGPGVALFANGKPYEDSWSEHGKQHGRRWTWRPDGRVDHIETFVDGTLTGPAEEWSAGIKIHEGSYLDDKRHGLWTHRLPTGLVVRAYYRGGDALGTVVGTREGVATAIVHAELVTGWTDGVARVFDASGRMTFERRLDVTGGVATAWSATGARIAEYDCRPDGAVAEARFYDDPGVLVRRWHDRKSTLSDRAGATLPVSDGQTRALHGVTDACKGAIWWLERPPPGRQAALGLPP